MSQLKVVFLIFALTAYMLVTVSAKPLENDGAEIVMKIEKINEQLPGVQAKLKNNKSNDDAKQKKSYPVYYVNTKVNGRFGKSMRAFTSAEFVSRYPVKELH